MICLIGNSWFRSKIQNSVKERKGYKDSDFILTKQILSEFDNQNNPLWTVNDTEKGVKDKLKWVLILFLNNYNKVYMFINSIRK